MSAAPDRCFAVEGTTASDDFYRKPFCYRRKHRGSEPNIRQRVLTVYGENGCATRGTQSEKSHESVRGPETLGKPTSVRQRRQVAVSALVCACVFVSARACAGRHIGLARQHHGRDIHFFL